MSPVVPFLAFALTAVLIVMFRPMAIFIGLVDVPGKRKSHAGNIPLIGGLAIFLAALIAMVVLSYLNLGEPKLDGSLSAFFATGLLLLFVGVWDDYRELPAAIRFLAQIGASLIMIFSGKVVLTDLGYLSFSGEILSLGVLSIPFTVFTCLGVINAINMSDGLDGLSGCLALVAFLGLGAANSMGAGPLVDQYLIVVFAACVIAFLMFNLRTLWRSKAWVFLGDAGSMLLGITLTWLCIKLSQGEARVISPAAVLWFLMLPIMDAVCMMLRRIMRGQSPFAADREHLHHILLLAGFTVGEVVTLMCSIALWGVVVGLLGTFFGVPDIWLAGAFLACGLVYYWIVRRAWKVMRFLRRSICRREDNERRSLEQSQVNTSTIEFAGEERRSRSDRRQK
jgi:UDP-GlcNAc:undecaprenyl-phosphate GlcNAc-1-phosphate transferase